MLYDDGRIALDDTGITLRHYYFPAGPPKRIDYVDVESFETRQMGWFSGKGRIWGSSDFRTWLALDGSRRRKDILILLRLDGWARPGLTPDDPDRVLTILRAHVTQV